MEIPPSVENIGKYAFATSYGNSSASKLNEVRIPASVEKIGDANSANNVFKDKKSRKLLQLNLENLENTQELFDLLLAKKRSADRKIWLEDKGDIADEV